MVEIHIFYGKAIFENLFDRLDIWNELISHLKQNKQERCKDILNIPDFDTSQEIREALFLAQKEYPKLIKNLLSNKQEFVELRKELFPTNRNLNFLKVTKHKERTKNEN